MALCLAAVHKGSSKGFEDDVAEEQIKDSTQDVGIFCYHIGPIFPSSRDILSGRARDI